MRRIGTKTAERGYTLLELMTVIAILAILMSILLYGMVQYQRKARDEGSKALLLSIKAAINEYHSVFRQYPPDGIDTVVKRGAGAGTPIKGSQCLVYFLGFKVPVEVEVGQDMRVQEMGPFLDITAEMLSGEGDLDERLANPAVELIDKYGNAVHYDDCSTKDSSGNYQAKEQADSHLQGGDMVGAPDPRKPQTGAGGGSGGSGTTGVGLGRNKGAYDLWSHGGKIADPLDDLTNWK